MARGFWVAPAYPAIRASLDVPLSTVLHSVSTRVADHEAFEIKRNETKLSVTSAA